MGKLDIALGTVFPNTLNTHRSTTQQACSQKVGGRRGIGLNLKLPRGLKAKGRLGGMNTELAGHGLFNPDPKLSQHMDGKIHIRPTDQRTLHFNLNRLAPLHCKQGRHLHQPGKELTGDIASDTKPLHGRQTCRPNA